MATTRKRVQYNILMPLICEEHYEHGPLVCCPFPGCSNGTSAVEIEAQGPQLPLKTYRRFVWPKPEGDVCFSWEEEGKPLCTRVGRVLWREAAREGLIEKYSPRKQQIIYHYTSPRGLLGIVESNELWMSDYAFLNDSEELAYGFSLASRRFDKAAAALPSAADLLKKMGRASDLSDVRVCVGSFSLRGDSFTFETHDLCDEFAQAVVRSATNRLASDLLGLQRILERFSPTSPKPNLKIVPRPKDKRFEHLILDILNEDSRHASVAPLLEDFLEKTDLRVKYPELKRRRGARVQITSTIAPEFHKAKLDAIRLAEEFVFLSPLSLAQFVISLQGHTLVYSISRTSPFTLAALWQFLKTEPTDAPQLAAELKQIMLDALTRAPNSPLGPLVGVPLPIRQLIRLFVKTHAIASTSNLREREGVVQAIVQHVAKEKRHD